MALEVRRRSVLRAGSDPAVSLDPASLRPACSGLTRDGCSHSAGCSDSVLVRHRPCEVDTAGHNASEALPGRLSSCGAPLGAPYLARAGKTCQPVADLEDAAFRSYLPISRTLAHTVGGDNAVDLVTAVQDAELVSPRREMAGANRYGPRTHWDTRLPRPLLIAVDGATGGKSRRSPCPLAAGRSPR